MITAYILTSSLFLLFLGIIWSKKAGFDVFCKLILLGLGSWGMFNWLTLIGYVVKG
jgi:hypothetical protein